MADYKIPNLCGASVQFNALQSKFDDMINTAASPAGLIADAKALAASLEPNVTSLLDEVKGLQPELPSLPDVNLQAELTSLAGLAAGSFEHGTLLAEITTKFGSGLTASGFSLDSLVSDAAAAITGGTDLCGAVPNFTAPSTAGAAAVQIANAVLQPEGGSVTEKPSVQLANPNVTEATTKATTSFNKFFRKPTETETLPTSDTGAYTVATKSTAVATSAGGKVSTTKVTTPKDATVYNWETGKVEKKNVSKDGFSTRPVVARQNYTSLMKATGLLLKFEPAGNYFPRIAGFFDLQHLSASDATRTKPDVKSPGWTKEEIERGWGRKQIFPDGHPASFGLAWTSKVSGNSISARKGAQQGKKFTDTFTIETGRSSRFFPAAIHIVQPTIYDYTGAPQFYKSDHSLYFQVKYKYNSKYDPNQKSEPEDNE